MSFFLVFENKSFVHFVGPFFPSQNGENLAQKNNTRSVQQQGAY
jgi:hypothetical protein